MLKHKEDIRTILFTIASGVVFIIHWNFKEFSYFLFCISFLQCFQQAVTIHNFAHCSVFSSKPLNDIYGTILTLLSGAPTSLYVPGHNESHHKHLETELDVMRTTQMTFKYQFLNIILFFPSIIFNIIKNDHIYMNKKKKERKRIFNIFLIENILLHFFMISLGIVNLSKFFTRYFIPTLIGKYMIVTLNMLQHQGCDPKSQYNHSRNFTGSILNYFCFNNGYHTQHHNFPGMHWSKLKINHENIKHHIHDQFIQPNIFIYICCTLFT